MKNSKSIFPILLLAVYAAMMGCNGGKTSGDVNGGGTEKADTGGTDGDTDTDTDNDTDGDGDTDGDTDSDADRDTDTDTDTDTGGDMDGDVDSDADGDTDTDTDNDNDTDGDGDTDGDADADSIFATDGSRDAIQAAVNAANPGDVVVVPTGEYAFVGAVTIDKRITLEGSGHCETVLSMANNTGETGILVTTGADGVTIRNLSLRGQPQNTGDTRDYGLGIYGVLDFRVLDCTFRDFGGAGVVVTGAYAKGVIAACQFIDIFRPEINNYGYGVLVNGNGSTNWDRDFILGSDDSVFVEDCSFVGNRHSIASNNGSRYVFRHNHTTSTIPANAPSADAHGFEFGSSRGSRGYEIYGNIHENTTHTHDWAVGIAIRGGDGVIFDNSFVDDSPAFEGFDVPILLASRMDLSTTCDYPNQDQTRSLHVWGNTLNGASVGVGIYSDSNISHSCLLAEGRDYFLSEKMDYVPYPYPHPLRGEVVDADGYSYPKEQP
jgi:hypothetical protein